MKRFLVLIALVSTTLFMVNCRREALSTTEQNRQQHVTSALLQAVPGDLIEFNDGTIMRIGGSLKPEDTGLERIEVRLDYPGTQGDRSLIDPAHVKAVYRHTVPTRYVGTDGLPSNPERHAWEEAAVRFTLQGTDEPRKIAKK